MRLLKIFCLILLSAMGTGAFAAEPSLRLTMPRTAHAPTLDGKLAPGEWDDAAAVTGVINQLDGMAHPRQATFWLKYDDKNVYVAQRSTLLPGERKATPIELPYQCVSGLNMVFNRLKVPEVMPPLYFKDNQNAVTIALAPNRVNSGDTPSHYRYQANVATTQPIRRELCDQIKGVKFISISSVWDSLDARQIPNNAASFNSFSADDTIWESEYAIPLGDMKVEKTPVGEEWGLLLARDYPQQDQNAIVQSNSYRFDYVARDWRNLVVMSAYHVEQDYARVRLVENEPVLQVVDLGDLLNGRIKPKLIISNQSAQPTTVTVKVAVGTKTQEQKVPLVANERKEWTADEIAAAGDAPQTLQLSVNNASGAALYQQTLPFRVGYGRDRTAFVPDMWMSGEPKVCSGAICAMSEYNPIRNTLWTKVKLAGRPGEEQRTGAEISVRRAGEEKPFVTYPMSSEVKGIGDYQIKQTLPDLKPGVYEITASLFGQENKPQDAGAAVMNATNMVPDPMQGRKVLARSRSLFIRYDHAKDLPWIGNKIGLNDKVSAPWTAIVTKETASGLDLSCWGRTYQIDGSGLPTQINTLGENILTAPVHMEMTRDGNPLPLTPAARVSDVHAAENEVNYTGTLQGDGWKIKTSAHLEYDGYLLYRIRLEPQGGKQKIDGLRFVIPLTNEAGRYMHAASCDFGNMRGSHTTQALKLEKGPLWDSRQAAGGPFHEGLGLTVGSFKSYVWVGGVKRGMAFQADNDKDWVPDDSSKNQSSEIVRTDTGVNLVLNLVARPFTFDHAREITFSLQATPVKPLPDDFRAMRLQLGIGTAFVGMDPDGWSWDGCQLWLEQKLYLGGNGTAPFPLNRQRNKDWNHNGPVTHFGPAAANLVVSKYMAMNAHFAQYEIDDPMVSGLQGANWYGYLTPEITGHRDIGDASLSQTEVEYRAYRYANWIRETGLTGFYFDNSFTGFSANPDANLGYVIDLPDRPNLHGQIQPGFAWSGIREMCKRLHNIFQAEGKRPFVWLHGTDTFVVGAYSFADAVLDGEEFAAPISPTNPWFSEKWAPEYMQTINDSSKWGFAVDMLELIGGFEGPNNVGAYRLSFRDISGYMMLHDLQGCSYQYLDWSGVDLKRKADFLPYWDSAVAAALKTGDAKILASGWRQDNALRIEVFNRSGEARKNVTVRINPKALGIVPTNGKPLVVKALDDVVPQQKGIGDDPYIQWPGDVTLTSHADGDFIDVTLDILAHDYRLFRIE